MRPLTVPARQRRQSRLLALAPLLLASVAAGCFAGESIKPSSEGPLAGSYVLTAWSEGSEEFLLPAIVTLPDGEYTLRYGTLILHEDGKYDELYELEREIVTDWGTVEVEEFISEGYGTWALVDGDLAFTATGQPAIFPLEVTAWNGRAGVGGHYAFNVRRWGAPPWLLHYRRY